ncbi:MAG: flavin reductase family protein [Rhodospirillaceae bacterium]
MAFDVKSFRRALGCFATGITVVTAAGPEGAGDIGITVNSFTSLSLDPPLILFCLGRSSRHLGCFESGREFVVNMLSRGQEAVSSRFAVSSTQREWAGVPVRRTESGTPMVGDCLAWLRCRVSAIHEGGDHLILVGAVEAVEMADRGEPLLYFRGRYENLARSFEPAVC